jgi:hypothetical protein
LDPDFLAKSEYCTNFLPINKINGTGYPCVNDNSCFMTFYPLCEHPFQYDIAQKNAQRNVEYFSGSYKTVNKNFNT